MLAQVAETLAEAEDAVMLVSDGGWNWQEILAVVGSVLGVNLVGAALVVRRLLKKYGITGLAEKLPNVLHNLDELAEKPFREIVRDGVSQELNGSLTELKQDHVELRKDVASIKDSLEELSKPKGWLGRLKG